MSQLARHTAATWHHDGIPAIVVSVIESRGSAPRDAGTRMLVSAGHTCGTIGGGHLELKAIEHARSLLDRRSVSDRLHFSLGPALGQCCGGAVTLGFEALDSNALATWVLPEPLFRLQLYGAGHVGRAIVRLLSSLDVSVDWIDERENEFPAECPDPAGWGSKIHRISVDAVEAEVARAASGTFYLVLTHNHDLDLRITEAILRRGDFGYLGLIGSKTKRERFLRRFEQRGIGPQALSGMTCPIGVRGIDGKEPETIAVAVVAQLLQVHQRIDEMARRAATEAAGVATPGDGSRTMGAHASPDAVHER